MPYRILFVCTGNTCRSPLAEAIARAHIEEEGLDGWEAASAGLAAQAGTLASSGALEVARENGLDLEAFQSRAITAEMLDDADLVLVMEPGHRTGVLNLSPVADTRTFLLGEIAGRTGPEAAVADPFGGKIDSYRRTFRKIASLVREGFPRIRELARAAARDRSRDD